MLPVLKYVHIYFDTYKKIQPHHLLYDFVQRFYNFYYVKKKLTFLSVFSDEYFNKGKNESEDSKLRFETYQLVWQQMKSETEVNTFCNNISIIL